MGKLYTFWSVPVHIRSEAGAATAVEGPGEAVELLESGRAAANGPHCRRALQICHAATWKTGLLAASREAFLAATLEAGLLWSPARREPPNPLYPAQDAPQPLDIRS
ncbi:DUF982 domain-containing protein [Martelella sp.]|uniref:DUF982 domain-containing protein n=1 Tax=Martelella sp. TaxID=1969699 RepID=UPI003242EB9E